MKRKLTREGRESNPRFSMMEKTSAVYGQIEKMFGAQVAALLEEYCTLKELDPYKVAFDEKADGTGSTLWDKFSVWAKNKKHVNVNAKFDDYDVDAELNRTSGRGRATRTYDTPVDSDIYGEGSGSKMDEFDILNWIYEEMRDCEWAEIDTSDISDDKAELEVALPGPDGDVFRVSVQKIWSGKLGARLD